MTMTTVASHTHTQTNTQTHTHIHRQTSPSHTSNAPVKTATQRKHFIDKAKRMKKKNTKNEKYTKKICLDVNFDVSTSEKKIKNRIKLNGTQMDFILVLLLQFAAMKIRIIFVTQGLGGGVALVLN